MPKVLTPCLVALALTTSPAHAADVAYSGVTSRVESILATEGHTATRLSSLSTLALVDGQGRPEYDVLVIGRTGRPDQATADAIARFVEAGGHVITEWRGSSYLFDAMAPGSYFSSRQPQTGLFEGTVHAGGYIGSSYSVDFVDPSHPLVQGLKNPLRERGGSQFFFWIEDPDERLEVVATIRGRGTTSFPNGDLPVLLAGCEGEASVVVAAWDWQDDVNGENADLLLNAVDYVMAARCESDSTPPVLDRPENRVLPSCTDLREVDLTVPHATDDKGDVTVTGEVVSINGTSASVPVDRDLELPIGESVVVWTATDAAGNVATARQTVTVAPAIAALDRLRVSDRAATDALVASYGRAEVGADATTGTVLANGDVFARSRALALGDVVAGGEVRSQLGAEATGEVLPFTDPDLPLVDWSVPVPDVELPLLDRFVNADTVETLPPGDYGRVIVNSRGRLVLMDGDYTFEELSVQSDAHLDVGGTSIVTGSFTWRGEHDGFLDVSVWGSGWIALETDFDGHLVAPEATVRVSGGARTVTGQILGGRLLVEPDVTLVCED